ncbi:tyrosine/serine protein phosphatase [Xylariaceae sp. FL0016]|nr:tyrosine/serine protein phosphatase [Xylariaceae sp. FL0016]
MSVTFENILNFRDVGKTVNDLLGQRYVQEGVLYRSARPDDATLPDRKRLVDELGIKTVIDLRTKTEHIKQAEKRQADLKVPTLLESNAALAEPMQIPRLRYLEIKVTGGRFEKFLLSQLTWWNYLKLILFYICGLRLRAIAILTRTVMLPRGLTGMAHTTLDHSGPELATALRALSAPSSLPLLVHCTQGKDRTGLIVALVLLALDVPVEAVAHDYMLSQAELEGERAERVAEMQEMGLTAEWGDCAEGFVESVKEYVDERYGGINAYLDSIGFASMERKRLVEALGA